MDKVISRSIGKTKRGFENGLVQHAAPCDCMTCYVARNESYGKGVEAIKDKVFEWIKTRKDEDPREDLNELVTLLTSEVVGTYKKHE